jgi:hypothetical protein
LSDTNQLWYYALDSDKLQFVESGITDIGATKSPDFIWILKGNNVYRYNNANFTTITFQPTEIYHSFSKSVAGENTLNFFEVKNVFQGIAIKYGPQIIYIPDFDNKQNVAISDSGKAVFTSGSSVFWIDEKGVLYEYNLELKTEAVITTLEVTSETKYDRILFYYYGTWKRVFVYAENKVYTFWFDRDISNSSIIKYYPYILSTGKCLPLVVEKNQFCIENNDLVSYKNTKIW